MYNEVISNCNLLQVASNILLIKSNCPTLYICMYVAVKCKQTENNKT